MKRSGMWVALAIVGFVFSAAGGYWWGMKRTNQPSATMPEIASVPAEKKILYYRNPMGLPDTSSEPKKDSMGMDYIPVYEEPSASVDRKILYYRNPMGLSDTSPVPKQDSMGMDYIPVYADEAVAGNQVKISLDKVQKLGVKTAPAEMRELVNTVRAVGKFQPAASQPSKTAMVSIRCSRAFHASL